MPRVRPSEGSARPQPAGAGLAALAALFADETRAGFCLALLDGRAWTASELARYAGVAASTTSEHLSKLVEGGLLAEERQGRHRYVRLADPEVAHLIEELAGHTVPAHAVSTGPGLAEAGLAGAGRSRTLRATSASSAMVRGRTCYDHLAGRLGIAITEAMTERGLLRQDTGFALTDEGMRWFGEQGMPLTRQRTRRPLVRGCLDWTERKPHLAGAAGAVLCRHAFEAGWCVRIGSGRAVKVTPEGERALGELLGISPETLR